MPRIAPTHRPWWLAGALVLSLGCGGGGPSAAPSDPAEGRKALQAALDAWKGGDTPDALEKRTPPIHVADVDWKAGLRLESYKADDAGKLVGSDLNYPVVLELKDAGGKAVKKNAVYVVTTHPKLLVLRQEDL